MQNPLLWSNKWNHSISKVILHKLFSELSRIQKSQEGQELSNPKDLFGVQTNLE